MPRKKKEETAEAANEDMISLNMRKTQAVLVRLSLSDVINHRKGVIKITKSDSKKIGHQLSIEQLQEVVDALRCVS